MSISSEITRLSGNVSAALTAIGNKGVTVPQGANSDDLATLIAAIETGDGGDEPSGPTYETIVPEQTFTPTNDYNLLTFTELLVVGETYRYIVNGVEKTGVAADFYGSIVLGSYTDYNSGTGGAFECVNNSIYYDTKLRTAQTVQVDRVVESGGGGGSSATLITKEITANGTYSASDDSADGYSQVTVNVPTSAGAAMNTQVAQGVDRVATTSYTAVSGQSITVEVTGTYDVYWTGFRSSTGGTNGSQLYIGSTAYGSAQTTFSNHGQSVKLTGVQLTAGQVVSVRARARGTNYYMYVGNLTIVQTA